MTDTDSFANLLNYGCPQIELAPAPSPLLAPAENLGRDSEAVRKERRKTRLQIGFLRSRVAVVLNELADLCDAKAMRRYKIEGYPDAPPPTRRRPPAQPGIYFIWYGGVVVYVGQSINLHNRIFKYRGAHTKLLEGDELSWLQFPLGMLDYAECFYIGTLWPTRNFPNSHKPIRRQKPVVP